MECPFADQRIPDPAGPQMQDPSSDLEKALLGRIIVEIPPAARASLRIPQRLWVLRDRLSPEAYRDSLELLDRVAQAAPELGRALLRFLPEFFEMLPREDVLSALCLARRISHASGRAAYGFLSHLVRIHKALGKEGLEQWVKEGIRLLGRNTDAGEAFFSLASSSGRALAAVPDRTVSLNQVREVLRLFVQGLSGLPLQIHSTTDGLAGDAGLLSRVYPATDGLAVYLPPQADLYPTCEENALYYKMLSAHQAGYFEAGTFAFSLFAFLRRAEGHALLRGWKPKVDLRRIDPSGEFLSPLQAFFRFFPESALARTIFTLVEDGRVDAHLRRRYPGLAADTRFFVQDVLARRPSLEGMPLRDAFLEILLRLSLDPEAGCKTAPEDAGEPATQGWARQIRQVLLGCLGPESTVEDSALASTLLYGMLGLLLARATVSGGEAVEQEWEEAEPGGELPVLGLDPVLEAVLRSDRADESVESLEFDELRFRVELRGATDLGATQKGLKAREAQARTASDRGGPGPWQSIPLEELKRLLEQGIRPALALAAGSEGEEGLLFFFDGPRDPQALPPLRKILEDTDSARYRRIWALRREFQHSFRTPADRVFHYREWDCLIDDYRPDWCRLIEREARPGSANFVQDVLSAHGPLLASLRKQFERLRPEQMRPERDLLDGEEIDLDRAVESLIDRRCGLPGRESLYRRRRKIERDVCTLFLLDMSSSTDERVKAQPLAGRQQPDGAGSNPGGSQADLLPQISWALAEARGTDGPRPDLTSLRPHEARRIIDIEKETLVLLAEALEPLGDRYGIFGFSGSGRLHVEFFTIKDFSEPYALPVKERLSGIEPRGSTRMGTALRHCKYRLRREQARRRNLILLSDGFPQDQDYGPRRGGHEYAVEDTARALAELEQEGTRTYCITVDRNGEDYLGRMCPKSRYVVIQDLAALPEALLMLYRKATDRLAAAWT